MSDTNEPLKPCQQRLFGSLLTTHQWTIPGPLEPSTPCDCGSVLYKDYNIIACQHGYQRRKCPVCEMVQSEKAQAELLDLLVRVVMSYDNENVGMDRVVEDILANPLVAERERRET